MMIEYLQTPWVSECIDYWINYKPVKLQFWQKTLELDPLVHINMILGIVHQSWFSKDTITAASFKEYEKSVNQFLWEHALENPRNINIISINASNATQYTDERWRIRKEDHNNSFQNSDELINEREKRWYTIIDFSSDSKNAAWKSKQEVLNTITQIIKEQPNKTHLIGIGLHWLTDWSSKYVLGDITKEDFRNIYQLGVNRDVILNIRSCFSYYKSDTEKNPNMITTYSSSKQASNKGFTNVQIASYANNSWDFNDDDKVSFAESVLYRSIYYNDSITPTYVRIWWEVRRI